MRTSTLPRAIGVIILKYGLCLAGSLAGGWLVQAIVGAGVRIFDLG